VRTISIAEIFFLDAFGRDVDFHDLYSEAAYLDIEKGDVIWIIEEDQDAEVVAGIDPGENLKLREKIDSSTKKYIEIPGRTHGEHHEILQEFLKSNWTDDGELRRGALNAYSGSIGRWIDAVGDRNVVHAYYNFRDSKLKELAEEFFQKHDIKPLWR